MNLRINQRSHSETMDKKSVHIIVGLIISLYIVWINYISSGYFITVGDKYYILNVCNNIEKMFHIWGTFLSQGFIDPTWNIELPYKVLECFLRKIGFENNDILNLRLLLFLFFSFMSCYFAGLHFTENKKASFYSAIFYQLNTVTIMMIITTGVQIAYFDIYVVLPIVVACFYTAMIRRSYLSMLKSVFFFSLVVPSLANIAFFILLVLFVGLFGFLYFLIFERSLRILKDFLIMYSLFFILINLVYSYASIVTIFNFLTSEGVYLDASGEAFKRWLGWMSIPVFRTLNLTRQPVFPEVNYYHFLDGLTFILIPLMFIPTVFIAILGLKKHSFEHREAKWFNILLILFPF